MLKKILTAGSVLILAMACRTPEYTKELPPGQMALRIIVDPLRYPDFSPAFMDRGAVLASIDRSLEYLARPSSKKYYPYLDITHERAVASLVKLKEILTSAASGKDLHRKIVDQFDIYESVGWDGSGTVLFTGYCEPIYEGSRMPTAEFKYPLYKLPADLVKDEEGRCLGRRTADGTLAPYYTRREIGEKNLLKGSELAYLRSLLDAYIVHVQGSARIRLTDGKELRVGYAGKTDRPYSSLGAALIGDGKVRKQDMSLAGIRRYFKEHPDELQGYLDRNDSYVFFTEREGGPYGSLNVPLTPMHSLATDKAVFPRAGAAFVVTSIPGQKDYSAMVMDQDTGGAIRAAGRSDLYFGSGPEMEDRAGYMYSEGRLYYVFARMDPVPPPAGASSK